MSTVFELDEAGWDQRIDDARLQPQPMAEPDFTDKIFSATGEGIMRGGARVGQFLGIAASVPLVLAEKSLGTEGILTDKYFRAVDETINSAVDFWTPDQRTVGVAGRVLGGLGEIALPLAATGGNPTLLIGSQQIGVSTDLVRQGGVDAATAVGVGGAQGAATAVGFKLPIIGKTLGQRVMTGAVGNVGVSMATTFAQRMTLEKRGYDELAEQYDPLDAEGRTVDLLIGAAFGFIPQGGTAPQVQPSARATILTGANARHFQVDTAPGRPLDAAASAAHQKAMETALAQLLDGDPVSVSPDVLEANFEPRPAREPLDLKVVSEIIGELPEQRAPLEQTLDIPPDLLGNNEAKKAFGDLAAIEMPEGVRVGLRQMYETAARVKPRFDAQVMDIAKEVGTTETPKIPKELKGVKRASEKAIADYGGDATKIKDIVRATIVVDNLAQAQAAIEAARARFGEPTKLRNLLDVNAETLDGYRDVNMNFKIAGHTVELQLNLPEIIKAKKAAHPLYKERRDIQAKSEFTAADDALITELDGKMKKIYAAAWNEVLSRSNSSAEISSPSSRAKLSETGRPDGTSNAMTLKPPDSPGTVETGTPPTFQKTDSLPSGHIADSSSGIIAENGQQPADISQGKSSGNQADAVQVVSTASGRKLEVKPKLIEIADAVTSDSPNFPKELQPRQRGQRKALDQQVRDIAQNLDPARLGQSAEADRGAPITGKGNIVESGNGRVMALRYVYENLPEKAAEYRAFLESQGYDTKGMKQPVLVRERITELDDSQRQAFTVEANQAATAALSPVERAQADARLLDAGALSAMRGGELVSAQNAGFVRAFLEKLPGSERNAMLNPDGSISQEGVRRIQAALLAKAYGGKPESNITLGRMLESTDSDMRSALGALLDAAPAFARLRQSIEDGKVSGEYDISGALTEAIENVAKLRLTGQSLRDFLAQGDMLTKRAPIVDNLMKALYDKGGTRISGREKIAATLTKYAGQAARQRLDQASLFAEPPVSVDDLVNTTTAEAEQPAPKVTDMFGLRTPQTNLATQAAKAALDLNDIEVPTGAVDADGNMEVRSGRDIMAQAEADIAKAEADAVGFDAAVSCILTRGLDDAA